MNALKKLDIHKSTGVDGLSAHLLCMVAGGIAPSITSLFNFSLKSGEIPSDWKKANVTPVPKSSTATSLVSNFRPISVLPVIAKVFESVVHQQLYSHPTSNSLLYPSQSGFRPAHSTQDVLIKSVDDWKIALDHGELVGTVLIDLSKALNSIDHTMLLYKLSANGVRGNELDWFRNYLSCRVQRVCIESTTSKWSPITRGVPQGSILGPLLFLIYVNDLPDVVTKCTVHLYADDTTIYCSNKDPAIVQSTLNTDLEKIAEWIEDNGLRMNVAKTQLMIFSRKVPASSNPIKINVRGVDIEASNTIKCLGVSIDKDLKWESHTNNIRNKSMAALASIRRSTNFLPVPTRKLLFNALVRPYLDYCSVVWHSCNSTTSQRMERIQNYGMRVILGKPPRTPSSPLRQQLNWTTLHQRRHNFMMNQVHRCALNIAPSYLCSKFTLNSTTYSKTQGDHNFYIRRPNTNHYRSTLSTKEHIIIITFLYV